MMRREPSAYVGRFAPSPTGPLHFGSLIAAIASYLQARTQNGLWLLRIEDIDPPREVTDADQQILQALEAYGFEWDGDVIYQSGTADAHQHHLNGLLNRKLAYPCQCSRRDLADVPRGPLGTIYPGTCRAGCCVADEFAIRALTNDEPVGFIDGLQGEYSQQLESETGDYIIKRRDGLIAYHLAVVVDDHEQGVTEIVRGIDLLDSTPRQIYLQRLLDFATPAYLHIPIVLNPEGQKLSKLTGAEGIPAHTPQAVLAAAFAALGQATPAGLECESIEHIWAWGFENWRLEALYGQRTIDSRFAALGSTQKGVR